MDGVTCVCTTTRLFRLKIKELIVSKDSSEASVQEQSPNHEISCSQKKLVALKRAVVLFLLTQVIS